MATRIIAVFPHREARVTVSGHAVKQMIISPAGKSGSGHRGQIRPPQF